MSAKSTVLLSGSSSAWAARKEPKNETERAKRIERFNVRKTRGYCYKRIPSFMRQRIDLDELANETFLVWRVYRIVYRNKPQYLSIASSAKIACGRMIRFYMNGSSKAMTYKQKLWDRWETRSRSRDAVADGLEALQGSLNPKHEKLLTLLLQGYSCGECATVLGVSKPRISAMLRKIGEAYSNPENGPRQKPIPVERIRSTECTPNGSRMYRPPMALEPLAKSTEVERDQFRNCPQYYGSVVE
jgi:hypothetical protein